MGAAIIALTYLLITVLCVYMSTVATYNGFLNMFGQLTVPLTAVVAAGLFASDMAILDRRRRGRGILGPIFVLLVFTAASFVSNFNYFYSAEMSKDLAADKLETATRVFDDNMATVATALNKEMTLPRIKQDIAKELQNLAIEIKDAKRGFGPNAKAIMDRIYGHIRRIPRDNFPPMTTPPTSAKDAENLKALADFEQRVNEALRLADGQDPWAKALAEVERARTTEKAQILRKAAALDAPDPAAEGRAAVQQLALLTQRVERNVQQVFEQRNSKAAFELRPTSAAGTKLNNITESLKSGFVDMPSPGKTAFAATAALLIDLFPLIFALVLIRPPKRNKADAEADVDATVATGPGKVPERRPPILRKVKG